jgi:hypothetical protein
MPGDYRFLENNWIRDEVTIGDQMYRKDYPIRTPEGIALYNQLIETFPEEENNGEINTSALESIGLNAGGLREPYSNDTISWYGYGVIPQHIREEYNILEDENSQQSDGVRTWYGKKYDLVTKEVMIKAAVKNDGSFPVPPKMLGAAVTFLGKLYTRDGLDKNIDYYFVNPSYAELNYFCGKYDLRHNVTAEEYNADLSKFCFSVIYNMDELVPKDLKVYRFFVYNGA